MSYLDTLVVLALILVCGFLILVVLLQKGRGGGLSGAFGGGGGGGGGAGSAFGAKTGDVFTWITVVLACLYMLISVGGNYIMDKSAPSTPAIVGGAAGGDTDLLPAGAEPEEPVEGDQGGDQAGTSNDSDAVDDSSTGDQPGGVEDDGVGTAGDDAASTQKDDDVSGDSDVDESTPAEAKQGKTPTP